MKLGKTKILCLGLLLFIALPCFAKNVTVKWKKVKGAWKYEVRILQEQSVVFKRKVSSKKTSLVLSLKPGYYYFRVRGIDPAKRPGRWSKDSAVVVNPPVPRPLAPNNNAIIMFGENEGDQRAKWTHSKGAHKYLVEVKRKKKKVYTELVEGTVTPFRNLPPGKYQWRVKAVVEALGAIPERLETRVGSFAASSPSAWRSLTVKPAPIPEEGLVKPLIVFPKGPVLPPDKNGRMTFDWEPVPGAAGYEVKLELLISARARRRLASKKLPKPRHFKATESQINIRLPQKGRYSWTVRALANYSPQGEPQKAGPQSVAEFKLDPNADSLNSAPLDVRISSFYNPFYLSVISPAAGVQESVSASSFSLQVELDYWISKSFGLAGFFEGTFFNVNDLTIDRKEVGIGGVFRHRLGSLRSGWEIYARLGSQIQESFNIIPDGTSQQIDRFSFLGPSLDLMFSKRFFSKFQCGFRIKYFYPMLNLAKAPNSIPGGKGRDSNYYFGIFSHYRMSPDFGLGLGAGFSKRSLAYTISPTVNQNGASSGQEEINIDSVSIFLRLILAWGR